VIFWALVEMGEALVSFKHLKSSFTGRQRF